MPLQTQLAVESFERWELEFFVPIKSPSMTKSYILVCMDYVANLVDSKALPKETDQPVSNFLYAKIFFRFGLPHEILTDGGPMFTSKIIKFVIEK